MLRVHKCAECGKVWTCGTLFGPDRCGHQIDERCAGCAEKVKDLGRESFTATDDRKAPSR